MLIIQREDMKAKKGSCMKCGNQVEVPPNAKAIRCIRCETVHDVIRQLEYRIREPVQQVYNKCGRVIHFVNNALSPNAYQGSTVALVPLVANTCASPPLQRPHQGSWGGGRKKALLIGVSYRKKSYELKGTINDVNCMKFFLVQKLKFPTDSIKILTEDEKDPSSIPTRQNILEGLRWLIRDCRSRDSLVFHYSGHGSQQLNHSGYEKDGYDETLCPLDYETKGMIVDDVINDIIVKPLPKGVKLHAIIDSCHSGTVLDLPYVCHIDEKGSYKWDEEAPPSLKGTSGGVAICISACADNQSSVDTSALSVSGNIMTGALTYSFIKALESLSDVTYGKLLSDMRSTVREASKRINLNGPIISMFNKVFPAIRQVPQLSSSDKFDICQKKFAI